MNFGMGFLLFRGECGIRDEGGTCPDSVFEPN